MCGVPSDDDKGKKLNWFRFFFLHYLHVTCILHVTWHVFYMWLVYTLPMQWHFFFKRDYTAWRQKYILKLETLISSVELIIYCWLCSHKNPFTSHWSDLIHCKYKSIDYTSCLSSSSVRLQVVSELYSFNNLATQAASLLNTPHTADLHSPWGASNGVSVYVCGGLKVGSTCT